MIVPRSLFGMAVVDGKIFALGGRGGYGTPQLLDSVESFSWDKGWQIEERLKLPEGLHGHCSVSIGNSDLYFIGGNVNDCAKATCGPTSEVKMINFSTTSPLNGSLPTWETLPAMKTPRWKHACAVAEFEGQEGILVSGVGLNDYYKLMFQLDKRNNSVALLQS